MNLPVNYNELSIAEKKTVREEYIKRQNGKCHYCRAPLDGPPSEEAGKLPVHKFLFPRGFFNWPVHLHHNHNTGDTIGAVHCHCNAVMWEYLGE